MIEILTKLILAMTSLMGLLQEEKLGGVLTEETNIVAQVITEENTKLLNSTYESYPFIKDGNYEKQVVQYKTPYGERGYQIYLRKEESGKIWERSESVGVEKDYSWRNYDWRIVGEIYDSTPTTTPK